MKKHAVILFSLILSCFTNGFAAWDGSTKEPSSKKVKGIVTYQITSPEELAWFSQAVNTGNVLINGVLLNDLVFGDDTSSVSEKLWTPIGLQTPFAFEGQFDGGDHTIYGISPDTSAAIMGVFGYVNTTAVVQNLQTAGASTIVGHNRGRIENCHNRGSFTGSGIAEINDGVISNCSNVGDVTKGGIVGTNNGLVEKCQNTNHTPMAGIAHTNKGTVDQSINNKTDNTTVDKSMKTGIVLDNRRTISNCTNYEDFSFELPGLPICGGVSTFAQGDSIEFLNVTNHGNITMVGDTITAPLYCGGIVGSIGGVYLLGDDSVSRGGRIDGALNTGNIRVSADAGRYDGYAGTGENSLFDVFVGGVAGFTRGVTINRAENRGNIQDSVMLTVGKAYTLNFVMATAGIVGHFTESVTNSVNSGNITVYPYSDTIFLDATEWTKRVAWSYTAGIAAYSEEAADSITFKNLVNLGLIVFEDSDMGVIENTLEWPINGVVGNKHLDLTYANNGYTFYTFDIARRHAGTLVKERETHCGLVFVKNGTESLKCNLIPPEEVTDSIVWLLNTNGGTEENSLLWSWEIKYAGFEYYAVPVFANDDFKPTLRMVLVANDTVYGYAFTDKMGTLSHSKVIAAVKSAEDSVVYVWAKKDGSIVDRTTSFSEEDSLYLTAIPSHYTITFLDFDGSVLSSAKFEYGAIPYYENEDSLSRPSTEEYDYSFIGWNPDVVTVTKDTTYIAVYDSTSIPLSSSSAEPENNSSSSESTEKLYAGSIPAFGLEVSGRTLHVSNAKIGRQMAVFDVQGHVLATRQVNTANFSFDVPRAGTYLVRIGAETRLMNIK